MPFVFRPGAVQNNGVKVEQLLGLECKNSSDKSNKNLGNFAKFGRGLSPIWLLSGLAGDTAGAPVPVDQKSNCDDEHCVMIFVGLDPTATANKPTAAAVLNEHGVVREVRLLGPDEAILSWLRSWGSGEVRLVGFDGPTALPEGLSEEAFARGEAPGARRAAELTLAKRGIGCFFTTSRSFAKPWALRCVKLAQAITRAGFRMAEVYPHATKTVLWGPRYPRPKAHREVRLWLLKALRALGVSWRPSHLPTHDELDAVVAALTAFLAWRGLVEWLGLPEPPVALPFERDKLPEKLFPNGTDGGKR